MSAVTPEASPADAETAEGPASARGSVSSLVSKFERKSTGQLEAPPRIERKSLGKATPNSLAASPEAKVPEPAAQSGPDMQAQNLGKTTPTSPATSPDAKAPEAAAPSGQNSGKAKPTSPAVSPDAKAPEAAVPSGKAKPTSTAASPDAKVPEAAAPSGPGMKALARYQAAGNDEEVAWLRSLMDNLAALEAEKRDAAAREDFAAALDAKKEIESLIARLEAEDEGETRPPLPTPEVPGAPEELGAEQAGTTAGPASGFAAVRAAAAVGGAASWLRRQAETTAASVAAAAEAVAEAAERAADEPPSGQAPTAGTGSSENSAAEVDRAPFGIFTALGKISGAPASPTPDTGSQAPPSDGDSGASGDVERKGFGGLFDRLAPPRASTAAPGDEIVDDAQAGGGAEKKGFGGLFDRLR